MARYILEHVTQATSAWFTDLKQIQAAVEEDYKSALPRLEEMKRSLGEIPAWAQQVRASMPDWGFEPCSHRWLDGLDAVLSMIENAHAWPCSLGHCGDLPTSVLLGIEQRAAAVESWLAGRPASSPLARQIYQWLGDPTPLKRQGAECFVELVRGLCFGPADDRKSLKDKWRARRQETDILMRLFYGDGLDGGLDNNCGHRTLPRLDIYLRVIGGDDAQLGETRWVCNTQLRWVLRDDPARLPTTLGYLWGIWAYLNGRDAQWLRASKPDTSGAAVTVFNSFFASKAPEPLRRWLAACLFTTIRFWYRRALSFIAKDEIPGHLQDVPESRYGIGVLVSGH